MSNLTSDTLDGEGVSTNTLESIVHRIRYYQHQAPLALSGVAGEISTLNGYFKEFNSNFDQL